MTSNPESTLTMADPVVSLLVIWGLASIGNFFKPQNVSVKSQISDALFEFRYPGTSFISKAVGFIIGYAISAVTLPFKLIFLILSIKKEIKIKEHNQNYSNNLESA